MEKYNYINMSYAITMDKGLNDKEKILLSLIAGFNDGTFRMGNELIATVMGIAKRTAQRTVAGLVKKELIFKTIICENGKVMGRIIKANKSKKLIKKLKIQ